MVTRENFLNPEVRCGFEVTIERKKIWKALLDIFETLIPIFDMHHIHYVVSGGSLLGAIRHGGIIPWDDDIDINVLREDYDRLEGILRSTLPSYYFVQTPNTDADYTITHIKVRDVRMSALAMYHVKEHRRYNMGVFLDIFPVDGIAPTEKLRCKQMRKIRFLSMLICFSTATKPKNFKQCVLFSCARLIAFVVGAKRLRLMRSHEESRYPILENGWGIAALGEYGYDDKNMRLKIWLTDVVLKPFEYLMVPCPSDYQKVLECQFGNWRNLVKGSGLHGDIIFDLDKDYKTKLIEEYGYTAEDFDS